MFRRLIPTLLFCAQPALADVGPCPITAYFTTEPQTIDTTHQFGPVEVSSTTMRAFVGGAMVQIECTALAPDLVFPGQNDGIILANYLRYWSIEPTGPAKKASEPVDHYLIEGAKDIQGIKVIYTYRLFRFEDSFAMVATGVPGGGQPPDVARFIASLRVGKLAPQPYTEAETVAGRRSHIASCLPAVRADNESRQLGLSEVEIVYFCSCTGQRYFNEFTRDELRSLAMGDDPKVEQRRLAIQTSCFEEAIR